MSAVEVRFENLSVEADVHVGGRALPTVLNSVLNFVEVGVVQQKRTGTSLNMQSMQLPVGDRCKIQVNMSTLPCKDSQLSLRAPEPLGDDGVSLAVQGNLQKARILRSSKHTFSILDSVSGTLTPVSPFNIPLHNLILHTDEQTTLLVLADLNAVQRASA